MGLTQFDPATLLRKQTKSEVILVILDFELQAEPKKQKSCASKEKALLLYGDSNRQIKDLLSEIVSIIRW